LQKHFQFVTEQVIQRCKQDLISIGSARNANSTKSKLPEEGNLDGSLARNWVCEQSPSLGFALQRCRRCKGRDSLDDPALIYWL
jgi:hypothetical protein